ncbi:hypothetical protein [Larkinella arboricola]
MVTVSKIDPFASHPKEFADELGQNATRLERFGTEPEIAIPHLSAALFLPNKPPNQDVKSQTGSALAHQSGRQVI